MNPDHDDRNQAPEPEQDLRFDSAEFDREVAADQAFYGDLAEQSISAEPSTEGVVGSVYAQRLDSVFHEISKIVQIFQDKEHSHITYGRVNDFVTGARETLDQFSPERAGEICRHLVYLLNREELFGLREELLQLGIIASQVRQRDMVINEYATDLFKQTGAYLSAVNALKGMVSEQLFEYLNDPMRYFTETEGISVPARVAVAAINLHGRDLRAPVDPKGSSNPFVAGCDLLDVGIESPTERILIAKALFNCCAQALIVDPFCERAQADRRHFIRSFDHVLDPGEGGSFLHYPLSGIVDSMVQSLWGNASPNERRKQLKSLEGDLVTALEGRYLRADTVHQINDLTNFYLDGAIDDTELALINLLEQPVVYA